METSRALSRCLRQLSIHDQSCLRTNTAAAATLRLRSQRNSIRHTSKQSSSSRAFHTSRITRQDDPASPKPQDAQNTSQPEPTQQPQESQPQPTPSQSPSNGRISLSSILDDPSYTPPTRRIRTSPSPSTNPSDRKSFHERLNQQIDSLVIGERARAAGRRPTTYDTYGKDGTLFKQTRTPTRPGGSAPSGSDLANNVLGMVSGLRDPQDQKYLDERRDLEKAREQLRLHPSLGKTVDVNDASGFNVTRAFITLEARINGRGNSVRKDARDQVFHVRRGQKKKLEKSARWRVVFKDGFLAECARVRKMIRQGW